MGTGWQVNYFKVETSTSSANTDSLYANGRMQIPVTVSIKAVETGTTTRYTLTDSDLNTIELVYYDDTSSTLSNGWSYTDQKDDTFAHTVSGQSASSTAAKHPLHLHYTAAAEVKAQSDDSPQTKTYWVTTTKVENQKVAARIEQSDGTTVTTHSSKYDSHVTLTGLTTIAYTTDNVQINREDTANGTYKIQTKTSDPWGSGGIDHGSSSYWVDSTMNWNQHNYYVSSNGFKFVKADIHDDDSTGYADGHPGDARLKNSFAYHATDSSLKMCFIWEFGAEDTKTAGVYGDDGDQHAYAYQDIKVNQKSNALCLTHLAFDTPFKIGGDWSDSECGFTIYDTYGNSGKFGAACSSDHDGIDITNAN
ncbi:hypothetical protein GGX14DRAFT_553534 [Mycena pura]|uniref:Uncharacterized protein n=1 Tax=Mycena pura TaxID=153505 RepID=A0AAD6YUI6_9AGAR|nr:hypothetical protein GGX14DRAFT_553534 [Mycena pura]